MNPPDGKQAIYSFIPSNYEKSFDRKNIIATLKEGINSEAHEELVRIISVYPKMLNTNEINFLDSIAKKMERFFALGLEEEVYKSVTGANLSNLIVFTDTNVLFSVLEISDNNQNEAIKELTSISRDSEIGYKFKYLPITITELNTVKGSLEKTIHRTEFQPSHIRVLLASGDLDEFSKAYYEKKLNDVKTPNPVYVLEDSRTILNSRGIGLFNRKFDFYEDENFINSKIKDYFEYETLVNRIRGKKGLGPKSKAEVQIKHDILLRESIVFLRDRLGNEHDLKYIGVTLDNQLLNFDKYMSVKKIRKQSNIIQPNFISPTNFLRRVRAFIPVKSDNYKRAFISAMTNLPQEFGDKEESISIQRSVSYFKQIGIQDEGAILNIVKNEVLYSRLNSFKVDEERSVFIQAEVDKYLQELSIQQKIKEKESELEFDRLKQEFDGNKEEYARLEKSNKQKDEKLYQKEKDIEMMSSKIDDLNRKFEQLEKDKKQKELIERNWKNDVALYRKWLWRLFLYSFFVLIPILGVPIISQFEKEINTAIPVENASFWIKLCLIFIGGILLLIRTFMNKKNILPSLKYLQAQKSEESLLEFKNEKIKSYIEEWNDHS